MKLIGALILVLGVGLTKSEYIRPLIDWNDPIYDGDDEARLSMTQKRPNIRSMPVHDCDESGCAVDSRMNAELITSKGYGVTFKIGNAGLTNSTVEIYIADMDFNVTLEYMYSTVRVDYMYRHAFQNYDENAFDRCRNGVGLDGFTGAYRNKLDENKRGKIWDFAGRRSTMLELGGWSQEATRCGHYWATTLNTCFEKVAASYNDVVIPVFKMTNEIKFKMDMVVKAHDKKHDIVYEGDRNIEQTIEIDDNLRVQIPPIGQIMNPLNSYYLAFKGPFDPTDGTVSVGKFNYLLQNVEALGSLSTAGMSRFQLVNLRDPSKTLFDKGQLVLTEDIRTCGSLSEVPVGRKRSYSKNNEITFPRPENYFKVDFAEGKQTNIPLNKPNLNLTDLKGTNDCCIAVSSPSSRYLETVVANFKPFESVVKTHEPVLPTVLKIGPDGLPRYDEVQFKNLVKVAIPITLIAEGYKIAYSAADYEIENVKIPDMKYYKDAAGSNFKLEFDYIGVPGNVKIASKDITLLTKDIYISAGGRYSDFIGFKNNGPLLTKPTVCVGKDNKCAQPDNMESLNPPDGSVDDPDTPGDKGHMDSFTGFWSMLFCNIAMAALSCFILLVDIFVALITIIVLTKLISKFGAVILMLFVAKDSYAFVTPNMLPDMKSTEHCNLTALPFRSKTMFSIRTSRIMNDAIQHLSHDDIVIISQSSFKRSDTALKSLSIKEMDFVTEGSWGIGIVCNGLNTTVDFSGIVSRSDKNQATMCGDSCKWSNRIMRFDTIKFLYNLKVMAVNKHNRFTYMEEFVVPGYEKMAGLNSVKILVETDEEYCMFTAFTKSINFKGVSVIETRAFGNQKKFAMEFTAIVDGSATDYYLVRNIRDKLDTSQDYRIDVVDRKSVNAVTYAYGLIQCIDKCTINNLLDIPDVKGRQKFTKLELFKNYDFKREAFNYMRNLTKNSKPVIMGNKINTGELEVTVEMQGLYKYSRVNMGKYGNMYDTDCSYTASHEQNEDKFYTCLSGISDILITDEGMHQVSEGGPIAVHCRGSEIGARCASLRGNTIVHLGKNNINFEIKTVEMDWLGKSYKYQDQMGTINVYPGSVHCKGHAIIDEKSRIFCSHHCCLLSDDEWVSFKVLKANQVYKPNVTISKVSMWRGNKSETYHVRSTGGCSHNNIRESWSCIWKEFPAQSAVFYLFGLFCIAVYILTSLLLNLAVAITKRCRSTKRSYKMLNSTAKKSKMSSIADNVMAGKVRFWRVDEGGSTDSGHYVIKANPRKFKKSIF